MEFLVRHSFSTGMLNVMRSRVGRPGQKGLFYSYEVKPRILWRVKMLMVMVVMGRSLGFAFLFVEPNHLLDDRNSQKG